MTFRIEFRSGGKVSKGSGVLVGNDGKYGVIVTNAHVVPRQPTAIHSLQLVEQDQPIMPIAPGYATHAIHPITAHHADGRVFGALFIGTAPKSDLAALVISTDAGYMPAATLAKAEPTVGAPVYQAGFPGGRASINYRSGTAKGGRGWSYQDGSDHGPIHRMQCIGGDSGSGIFDSQGALTGILWGGGNGETCAVGLAQLRAFTENCCRRWLKPRQPSAPGTGPGSPNPSPLPGGRDPGVPSPPAMPDPPVYPPSSPPAVDLGPVMQAIAALDKRLTTIQLTPGPPGPPGPPGKDGRDGLDGKDADPAELARLRAEVEALRKFVNNLSGSVRVRIEPVPKQ